MHSAGDLVMCLDHFNGQIGRHIDEVVGVHGRYGVDQWNLEGRMLLEFCMEKELCVLNTWIKREEKRKVTFTIRKNDTEIDFVLIKKESQCFIGNVKTILGEFQHALVVADIDKTIRNVVRRT